MKVLIDNFKPLNKNGEDFIEVKLGNLLDGNPLKHLVYIDDDLQYYIESA